MIGVGYDLQWMRISLERFKQFLLVCMKKVLFIEEQELLTGVQGVPRLYQMKRLNIEKKMAIFIILDIL